MNTEKKHSGMGIASFIISVLVGVMMLCLVVLAGLMNRHRAIGAPTHPATTLLGLGVFALMGLDIVALALGIASICQTTRNRLFGILGLVFSIMILLGTIGLVILGLAVGHHVRH